MPRLDSFRSKTETQTFNIDGEPVEITYTPGRITGADLERLGNLDLEADADFSALYNLVEKSIQAWDITGPLVVDGEELVPDGEAIPVTAEYVRHIPVDFLGDLMATVQEASVAGPKSIKAKGR